jgi:hypothetical protein
MNFHQTNRALTSARTNEARLGALAQDTAAAEWRPSATTRYAVYGREDSQATMVVAWDVGELGDSGVHVLHRPASAPTLRLAGVLARPGSYHPAPSTTAQQAEFRRALGGGREVDAEQRIWTGTEMVAVRDLLPA